VGIDIEGKSAEQLSALITEAAKRPPEHATIIDPHALSKHFEEGRFTDCIIRVKIGDASADVDTGRPAKRLRGMESEGPADQDRDLRVIKAHAVILASRSAYFERAMGAEWRESQDRSFEVEVADETGEATNLDGQCRSLMRTCHWFTQTRVPCFMPEYVTFQRLIKMCYGTTFIKEGDRDLDVSELVWLVYVANAFECMDAVRQCMATLQGWHMDWEGAVQCIELTEMLKDVEGVGDLAKKAAGVVAKAVGPVHKLFTPAQGERDGGDVLGGLRLSKKVKVRKTLVHLSTRIVFNNF
jgi:hypothetical protein